MIFLGYSLPFEVGWNSTILQPLTHAYFRSWGNINVYMCVICNWLGCVNIGRVTMATTPNQNALHSAPFVYMTVCVLSSAGCVVDTLGATKGVDTVSEFIQKKKPERSPNPVQQPPYKPPPHPIQKRTRTTCRIRTHGGREPIPVTNIEMAIDKRASISGHSKPLPSSPRV